MFPSISYAADVTWGSEDAYDTGTILLVRVAEIDTDKFAVAYLDSSAGQAIVGTVSGTTITWGTVVEFDADINVTSQFCALGLAKVNTDKFVVAYSDDSLADDGYARVTTVTTRTIDGFGTASEFETGDTHYIDACQLGTDKFVVVFADEADGNDGKARVGTATGTTTITWGTADEYEASGAIQNSCAQLDTDKFIVNYREGSGATGESVVYTVSTRTLTEGTHLAFSSDIIDSSVSAFQIATDQIDTDKFIVFWTKSNASYEGRIGTVSTRTITYSEAQTTINTTAPVTGEGVAVTVVDSSTILFGFLVQDTDDKIATVKATVSGSVLSLGDEEIAVVADSNVPALALISTDKVVLAFQDTANSYDGYGQVGDIAAAAPSGAPQVIIISEEEKEKKLQWVKEQFKKDYASGKIM